LVVLLLCLLSRLLAEILVLVDLRLVRRGIPLGRIVDKRGLADFDWETYDFAFFGLLPAVVLDCNLDEILNVEVFAHERRSELYEKVLLLLLLQLDVVGGF